MNRLNRMLIDTTIYCTGCLPATLDILRSAASLIPGSCQVEMLSQCSKPLLGNLVLQYLDSPFSSIVPVNTENPVLYVAEENYFDDRIYISTLWPIEAIAVVIMQALSATNKMKDADRGHEQSAATDSARKFEALMAASPDLIFILTEDGDFEDTLASDESLLIQASGKLCGRSVYEIVPEHLAPQIRKAIEDTLSGIQNVELHYEHELPIGKRFFHARFSDMNMEINGKRMVVLISRNATETVQQVQQLKVQNQYYAEQVARFASEVPDSSSLKESAQRFDEIARMMPQAIVEIDTAGNILFVNTHATVLTGYSEAELLAINVKQLLSPRDLSVLAQRLNDKEKGTLQNNCYKIIHKSGREILVQALSSPLYLNGTFIGRRAVLTNIEEQKRREEILKDQALFMRFNPAPNFKIDPSGNIVSCNPAAIRLFKADYAGMHISQIFPDSALQLDNEKFNFTASLAGRTYNFYAVRGLYSSYMYFFGADITEIIEAQARNQQLLQLQQERLKKLNCLYQISNIIQNPRSEVEVIEQVLQKVPESYQFPHLVCMRVIFKDIDMRTSNYEETEWKQQSRIYAGKKEVGLLDIRYSINPGEYFEGPFMQEERQLISAIGFLLGALSRRLQAEAENRMLRKAVEQNPASIMICDADLKIEFVNHEYTHSCGYTESELIGRSVRELAMDGLPEDFYETMWAAVRGGSVWHGDVQNRTKNGDQYWERESVSPIYDESGVLSHFVEIKENISERKQMEEELRQAMLAAESANRAKSEFLANVSHEIRTPLNSIVGFSDLLQAELHERKLISYLDSIKNSGQNLLSLINDILDLAKIEAGKLDINYLSVNIRNMFSELESMFSLRIQQKQLHFSVDVQAGFPQQVSFDELRLKQIVINLLSNAIKFTQHGSISLSLRYVARENENAVDMQIAVADTGEGIDADQLENIFLSFNQGKDSRFRQSVGTGLGLTISRRLTELMGGTLTAVSEKGKGSTFSLSFNNIPVCDDPRIPKDNEVHSDCINVRFGGQRILVVDDQSTERKYVEMGLGRIGLAVYAHASPLEAIEKVLDIQPDVVITDIVMPEMNGFELAERLHEKMPDVPIVAMSASILKYAKRLYGNPHFTSILVKPFFLEELYTCMMQILPYEIIAQDEEFSIESEIQDTPPELVELLRGSLFRQWVEFGKQQPIDELKIFAENLISAGETFARPDIIHYGQSLIAALETFDVEQLLAKLREYPSLVDKICNVASII